MSCVGNFAITEKANNTLMSVGLPSWNSEPVIRTCESFDIPNGKFWLCKYPNLIEIQKGWYDSKSEEGQSGDRDHKYVSVFDGIPTRLGFYVEECGDKSGGCRDNSINLTEKDGRFTCNHEMESHALKSRKFDNSNIIIQEVCKNL